MVMFALASIPLIKKVATPGATQSRFANDASTGGRLQTLRTWCDKLVVNVYGPFFGYYPNANKTLLLVNSDQLADAEDVFGGTGIKINSDGCRHLGAGLGTASFRIEFTMKVEE